MEGRHPFQRLLPPMGTDLRWQRRPESETSEALSRLRTLDLQVSRAGSGPFFLLVESDFGNEVHPAIPSLLVREAMPSLLAKSSPIAEVST